MEDILVQLLNIISKEYRSATNMHIAVTGHFSEGSPVLRSLVGRVTGPTVVVADVGRYRKGGRELHA